MQLELRIILALSSAIGAFELGSVHLECAATSSACTIGVLQLELSRQP